MKTYAATGQGDVGTDKTIMGVTASASVRPQVIYMAFGAGDAVADATGIFQVRRSTAAGTSTAVTPKPLDPADIAAVATSGENHSVEPTYTAAEELWQMGMNQRNSCQWWAYDADARIVIPATAANGIGLKTLSYSAGTPNVDATVHWKE